MSRSLTSGKGAKFSKCQHVLVSWVRPPETPIIHLPVIQEARLIGGEVHIKDAILQRIGNVSNIASDRKSRLCNLFGILDGKLCQPPRHVARCRLRCNELEAERHRSVSVEFKIRLFCHEHLQGHRKKDEGT